MPEPAKVELPLCVTVPPSRALVVDGVAAVRPGVVAGGGLPARRRGRAVAGHGASVLGIRRLIVDGLALGTGRAALVRDRVPVLRHGALSRRRLPVRAGRRVATVDRVAVLGDGALAGRRLSVRAGAGARMSDGIAVLGPRVLRGGGLAAG